ncbi:hypothetical protein FACS1894107_14180 [Planctomycetales bacterium]|nr:hypothetical protein FACS1894107_14180 [Planctomycetales bacterium]GHS97656.1 hypothetical protein FACS1894108_04400 [Planctomycetales bacterium]
MVGDGVTSAVLATSGVLADFGAAAAAVEASGIKCSGRANGRIYGGKTFAAMTTGRVRGRLSSQQSAAMPSPARRMNISKYRRIILLRLWVARPRYS